MCLLFRYLLKLGMDDLIEFLQINLEKDFGVDDDAAIDNLRELINALASNRMDSPGRPPQEELPQRPFGLLPELTAAEEAGLRTGLTEREREFGADAIRRQRESEDYARRKASSRRGQHRSSSRGALDEEDDRKDSFTLLLFDA